MQQDQARKNKTEKREEQESNSRGEIVMIEIAERENSKEETAKRKQQRGGSKGETAKKRQQREDSNGKTAKGRQQDGHYATGVRTKTPH